MEEVEFFFDHQLIAEVENLIRTAKHKLLLISPFIDLDARIIDALNEKKSLHNFQLLVLFGKNEGNYYKSVKKDSLELFKQFPNVEIRYNERLHAKFYLNDSEFLMTSLNLYDYSLANNIEVGIKGQYSSKGILGKALYDAPANLISQGVDKLKGDYLGMNKDVNPIEKFKMIFESSDLKYKTEPITSEKDGFKGLLGGKILDGFNIIVDKFKAGTKVSTPHIEIENKETEEPIVAKLIQFKLMSASQLSKVLNVPSKDITSLMQQKGLINGENITNEGIAKGLIIKSYMGNSYIAYPDNLVEFKDLKR